ncbi:MAG: TIGR01212 family radical SAM protein [Marinilabiliaceae bacterium]|nr:TIGR01212 family radical SAM protein [Marinilabiliaceae bacterium]
MYYICEQIYMMVYPWVHTKRYNDYSSYIKNKFGERVQKVSVNAGFTCPNRDGSKGIGGCAFCNNSTFNPSYCDPEMSITEQINQGISFFRTKYQSQKYLAYFQAYTNTYAKLNVLIKRYQEALSHPLVCGIVIGTRPDCIEEELLDVLSDWQKDYYIAIELGAESTRDKTLLEIHRGHTWEESVFATNLIHRAGIPVGMHLILGLPNENRELMLEHAKHVSNLPLSYLKLHQLQIVKGSKFAELYSAEPNYFNLFSPDDFVELVVDFLERLSPHIIMERFISQAPHDLLIAPKWGLKNFEFVHMVEQRMEERDTWQGRLFTAK